MKIIIPLYNTVNTIVFKSRETLCIALPFLIQRNICHKIWLVGTVVAFKNVYCLVAGFYIIKKNDKWM